MDANSIDDDAFYDELRKQILLLTEEDDAGSPENKPSSARKGAKVKMYKAATPPVLWSDEEENGLAPIWLVNLWRNGGQKKNRNGREDKNGNGTGVFIPNTVNSRTRVRPRKGRNDNGRAYKPVEGKNERQSFGS